MDLCFKNFLFEGQITPSPEEQKAYDRLVTINNAAGIRDFTDALLQWYRTALKRTNTDISFDETNHIRDILKVLNKNLSNNTLKPGTYVTVQTPKGTVKKDLSNPRHFFQFETFEKLLNQYLNNLTAKKAETHFSQKEINTNIKLFAETSDLIVFTTRTYEATLEFIRILWPKMRGTSNLGAYGANAYNNDLCPYCTSGKSHWDEYSSGKNYTQYWFLKNIGNDLKDYYGKGKKTLYAMLDSNGDLLDKKDSTFNQYFAQHSPSFVSLIQDIYEIHKKQMDKKHNTIFNVLNTPTQEEIENMQNKFIAKIKKETKNGVYPWNIEVPTYFNSLIKFKFIKKIEGIFNCARCLLQTLEGAPQIIEKSFFCDHNNLQTLEGGPHTVGGHYNCNDNSLYSLKGAPQKIINGNFMCSHNLLPTLEGAPQNVGREFHCHNNSLQTLEGAPHTVGGSFYCDNNSLQTLEGAPQKINGNFSCCGNSLQTLEGAPHTVDGSFYCAKNPLQTLKGGPRMVGSFFCRDTIVKSLEGAPEIVKDELYQPKNFSKKDFYDAMKQSRKNLLKRENYMCIDLLDKNLWKKIN